MHTLLCTYCSLLHTAVLCPCSDSFSQLDAHAPYASVRKQSLNGEVVDSRTVQC